MALRPFAEYVDDVIRSHTTPAIPQEPEYDDEGEDPTVLVGRAAGVNERLARFIVSLGRRRCTEHPNHYDFNLSFTGPLALTYRRDWKRLQEIVRFEARYLGKETRTLLDRLLGGVDTLLGGLAIRKVGPEHLIYRARVERAQGEADGFYKSPESELTAPPAAKATPGRMNPAGIRVFYGALTEKLCIAEVRPPLGSRVVTGAFRPCRPMRILDLGAFGEAHSAAHGFADVFDPQFDALSERLEFLRLLERTLARPILPFEETLEYVPTQVVGEYVAHVLGLDGVAYRSAQAGDASQWAPTVDPRAEPDARNVALFGAAGRTAREEPLTEGIEPGLQFEPNSQHMVNVTYISVKTEDNMWVDYPDPSDEPEPADEI